MDHRIERERLIFFCRVEEQSAPETRASATPRRGGGTAVPFYEGGSGGQPTDPKAGERWRHVWCASERYAPPLSRGSRRRRYQPLETLPECQQSPRCTCPCACAPVCKSSCESVRRRGYVLFSPPNVLRKLRSSGALMLMSPFFGNLMLTPARVWRWKKKKSCALESTSGRVFS